MSEEPFGNFADFSRLHQSPPHFQSSSTPSSSSTSSSTWNQKSSRFPSDFDVENPSAMIEVQDMSEDPAHLSNPGSPRVKISFWELSLWDLDVGDPDGVDYSLSQQSVKDTSAPLQRESRFKRFLISSSIVTPSVERKFLSDACGSIEGGKITCIAAPYRPLAKALVNLLAGTKTHGEIEGQLMIQYRGTTREEADPGSVAFLDSSHEAILRKLTVRQFLYLAGRIRSSPSVSRQSVMEKVTKLLHDFRLERFANVKMAGGIVDSAIGRLNESLVLLAAELLGDPVILYGIDPLDGLTADEASQYMGLLKQHVKETGLTVVFYLNRPGTDVFKQLDNLVLLANTGELVYCGPAKQAVAHFSAIGYSCPEDESPGRYLVSLFDDGYQVLIGNDAVNPTMFAEKYRETLTETVQPFATSSRRNVEKVNFKGKSGVATRLGVSLTRAFSSRFEKWHILSGLAKFVLFAILVSTVSVDLPFTTKNGQTDRMSILFISVALFHFLPSYSYQIVAQERALLVKERRFGHVGFIGSLFSSHLADSVFNLILAAIWMLLVYFMVPFLYDGEDGPLAAIIFFVTLLLTADLGMSFLAIIVDQTRKPLLSLSTFFYVLGFLNASLSGYFVHPYNISQFWKPFLWISPLHLSWSTLVLTEFALNFRYSTYQIISLEGVGLWVTVEGQFYEGLIMQPQEMALILLAVTVVMRLLSAFLFSFRKLT